MIAVKSGSEAVSGVTIITGENGQNLAERLSDKGGFVIVAQPGIYSGDETKIVDMILNIYLAPELFIQQDVVYVRTMIGKRPRKIHFDPSSDNLECVLVFHRGAVLFVPDEDEQEDFASVKVTKKQKIKLNKVDLNEKNVLFSFPVNKSFSFAIRNRTISTRQIVRDNNIGVYVKDVSSLKRGIKYVIEEYLAAINYAIRRIKGESFEILSDSHVDTITASVVGEVGRRLAVRIS